MRHLCRYLKLLGLRRYSVLLTIRLVIIDFLWCLQDLVPVPVNREDCTKRGRLDDFEPLLPGTFSSSRLWRSLIDKWKFKSFYNPQTKSSLILPGRSSIRGDHTSNSWSLMDFQGLRITIWPRQRKPSRKCNIVRKFFVSVSSHLLSLLCLYGW